MSLFSIVTENSRNKETYFEIYCNSVISYIDSLEDKINSGDVEDIANMLDYLLEEIFYETNIKALCGSDNEFNVRGGLIV